VRLREALVAAHGATYVTRGRPATVERWCASIPASHVRSSPALCALSAIDALHRGDGARALQWCGLLERSVDGCDAGTSGAEPPALWAAALRATLATARAADLSPYAEHATAHLDGGPWHALAHLALGGLRFLLGDARATESFAAGEFEAELAGLPLVQATCIAAGAVVAELAGDGSQAEHGGRRAEAVLVGHQAKGGPTTALLHALHALGAARRGDHGAATAALSVARQGLTGYEGVAPWYNVLARLPLARAALLIDDRAAGRKVLGQLDRHLRWEPEGHGARDHLDVLRASLEAAGGGRQVRGPSLTGAELNVLRYLPTNLTIAEIATRLYVSRNTVKTHVAAIHRKFGTASRRDTVGLARRSGLLDDLTGPGPA
jgi:LuxR family maltose regulon positive regulatory protein